MIKTVDSSLYREDIISLWQEAFGDEQEYIEFFLDNCPNECIGCFLDDELCSLLFLLDGSINGFKTSYIYAACTKKSRRGQGLFTRLLNFTISYCEKKGDACIFLVPGEESLYSFYKNFGFVSNFYRNELEIFPDKNYKCNFSKIENIKEISELRKKYLTETDSFIFSEAVMRYCVEEYLRSNGEIFSDNDCLIFSNRKDNYTLVKEFLASDVKKLKIFEQFINYDTLKVYIHCPIVYNTKDKMVKCTKCGMCLPLTDEFKNASVNKMFYAGMYLD